MGYRSIRKTRTKLVYWQKVFIDYLIGILERLDSKMTSCQRKCFFYLCVLCCSGCLFYWLGTAVRKSGTDYTQWPFMPDSGLYRAGRPFRGRSFSTFSGGRRRPEMSKEASPQVSKAQDSSSLETGFGNSGLNGHSDKGRE